MGAGIVLRNGGYLTIEETLLQGNHAQGKGGGIYLDTSSSTSLNTLTLKQVRCTGNSASFGSSTGGCLYSRGHALINILDSNLVDNMAALSGGAVAIHDAGEPLVISNSNFQKNRARGGEGGAVLVESSSEKVLAPVKISGSRFEQNRAETYGGALAMGNTINSFANLEVVDSVFQGNTANSSQSGAGGAIYFVSQAPQTMRIVGSRFESNQAELAGGAVYAVNPQMVWIQNSKFFNNAARGASTVNPRFGGAIMLDGATVTFVQQSKLCGNIASSTGGKRVSGVGGGMYLQNGDRLVFEDNWIWENEAQEVGGALATDGVGNLELSASIFAANRSLQGGAIYLRDTSSTAKDLVLAFTQAGSAAEHLGSGTHQWGKINWYNNVDGDGSLGPAKGTPLNLTTHSVQNPNFSDLVVDSRCNDTLTTQ
jgi:predicted outer membrane repeat protein